MPIARRYAHCPTGRVVSAGRQSSSMARAWPATLHPDDAGLARDIPAARLARGGAFGPVRPRELVLPPNVLSLARIPLAAIFAVAALDGDAELSLGVLILAGATDVADGWCARRLGQVTATGRVVDPAADKIFFLTAAVALVAAGRLAPLAALVLATREIVQAVLGTALALRGRLLATGAATPSSPAGKMTTLLQASALAAALVWPDARDPLVVAAAVCGAAAAADYWISAVRAA